MRRQSIATRKYLDRFAKDNPQEYEEFKRKRKISSAVSALRLYATESELNEVQKNISTVQQFLKDNSNLSKDELKKLRLQTFKKKRGRPKQDK